VSSDADFYFTQEGVIHSKRLDHKPSSWRPWFTPAAIFGNLSLAAQREVWAKGKVLRWGVIRTMTPHIDDLPTTTTLFLRLRVVFSGQWRIKPNYLSGAFGGRSAA